MKNVMRKIGRIIVAFLPVAACLLLQIGVSIAAGIVITLAAMLNPSSGAVGAEDINQLASQLLLENIMSIQIASQIAMLIVFGCWYYFAYGRKKRPETAEKPDALHVALLLPMGLLLQFGISSVLSLIEAVAPQVMEGYNELMELAGLGEMSPLAMIAVSIMAPLSEEVLCRGVILRLAERVSPRFWVANFIQALAFGILHGNLVQGSYAFLLGLLLGYLYGKYRNIWLCMLLHGAMNLSSYLVNPFYMLFPESALLPVFLVVLAASIVLFVLCLRPYLTKKQGQESKTSLTL
ncbi:MAG: CPBP family intramembrane metalloprotease [Roseburia sp.]|nr:CPBP family intramembrane metalloprotease [Roseburia sp.]MCM1098518.1 CPBP family intramembrane metalloprotease [Ruminococcus flavefaciens]